MFKYGTDMQGYLQYVHYGAILALLEELKNILMEHYWKTEDKVKDETSEIQQIRPLKIHKVYFFVGKLKQAANTENADPTKIQARMKSKIIDEKNMLYFRSNCLCTNSDWKNLESPSGGQNVLSSINSIDQYHANGNGQHLNGSSHADVS